ncbi:MAG: hypothetical protein H3C31_13825, partial [Brumimicrobium sp.]|nr:hypothetical protein [Brumimicrobium sp.]
LDTFSPIGKPYQKEFLVRNIYGSSRLGATKEAVNMQNPSLLPSYGILGNRNYELSDHRGNVQTVINDIKYPVSSNNTSIDYYTTGISNTFDYSPFGAPLDGRTIENIFHYPNSSVDTLFVSDTLFVINNDFENPVITTNGVSTFIDGWKDFSQSTISIENTGGNNQLKVVSTNGTHGIHQTFAIENGETYTFEVDLTKVSVPSGVVNVVIYQGPSPGVPYSVHVLSSNGTNTFSYTANSSDIYVQIRQSGTYLLDNIRLYREYEDTVIVGGYAASGGYRYSFQNQEKHDEIRGKGNYINYKYRGYDPRVGRLDWMMDPLADSYPWNSPYAFSENDLIRAVELEGLEKEVVIDNSNSPSKDKPVNINVGAKGAYDVLNDVYFGSVLKQMNSEGLINSYSTVTFTWTGQRTETKNKGPWYWKTTTTDLYLQYNIGFNYEGVDVSAPIEIGAGVIAYHPGSNPVDYGLALVGTGAYAMAFRNSVVNNVKQQVINQYTKILQGQGVKIATGEALSIGKNLAGKIVWLAEGTEKAGLKHILSRHTDDFVNQGILKGDIGDFVFDAVKNGKVVGTQGSGNNARTIYETIYKGQTKRVAASVSDNGFIVGANPVSIK